MKKSFSNFTWKVFEKLIKTLSRAFLQKNHSCFSCKFTSYSNAPLEKEICKIQWNILLWNKINIKTSWMGWNIGFSYFVIGFLKYLEISDEFREEERRGFRFRMKTVSTKLTLHSRGYSYFFGTEYILQILNFRTQKRSSELLLTLESLPRISSEKQPGGQDPPFVHFQFSLVHDKLKINKWWVNCAREESLNHNIYKETSVSIHPFYHI